MCIFKVSEDYYYEIVADILNKKIPQIDNTDSTVLQVLIA